MIDVLKKGFRSWSDLHCTGRAGGNAKFADAAFFLIEINSHFRPAYREGTGWANRCAGTALNALVIVPIDLLIGIFNLDPLFFKILNAFVEVFFGAGQLEHHNSFLSGKHRRLQKIEDKPVLAGKVTDHRFLDLVNRKSEN